MQSVSHFDRAAVSKEEKLTHSSTSWSQLLRKNFQNFFIMMMCS